MKHELKRMDTAVEEEDDPVVQEMDVYVCNDGVGAQLTLLSHPLRPPWRPYDYGGVRTVRMKQAAKRLEVDIPLETYSPNYDLEDTDEGMKYKQISKVTLRSNQMDMKSSLAMGTIQDGKLLLAPLDLSLQLKPTLAHLNVHKKGDGHGEDGEEEDEEPAMKAVEVQVNKRETERQIQARLNSYAHIAHQEEEEPWKELKVHHSDSGPANTVWTTMMTPSEKKQPHIHMSQESYLAAILPPTSSSNAASGPQGRGGPPGPGARSGLGKEGAQGAEQGAEEIEDDPGSTEVSEEVKKAFTPAMKALFSRHGVCTMANVRQWLLDPKSGSGAAKDAATLIDQLLDDLVMSAGLPIVKIKRLYVLRQTGKPDLDPFRGVVVDLLMEKDGFKRSEVIELSTSQGKPVTDALYSKVVKEICVSRGQQWLLKNGADM